MAEEKRRHFGGQLYIAPDKGKERSQANINYRNLQEKHLKCYLRGKLKVQT